MAAIIVDPLSVSKQIFKGFNYFTLCRVVDNKSSNYYYSAETARIMLQNAKLFCINCGSAAAVI
jgi:hypothetical protein